MGPSQSSDQEEEWGVKEAVGEDEASKARNSWAIPPRAVRRQKQQKAEWTREDKRAMRSINALCLQPALPGTQKGPRVMVRGVDSEGCAAVLRRQGVVDMGRKEKEEDAKSGKEKLEGGG